MCGYLRWSVLWVTGCIGGLWFGSKGWVPFAVLFVFTVLAVIVGGWWFYHRWSGLHFLLLVTAFMAAAAYMTWVDSHNHSVWSADARTEWVGRLHGHIVSPIDLDGNRVQFTLKSDTWQNQGSQMSFSTHKEKVLVRLFLDKESELDQIRLLTRGDRVKMQVSLEQPQQARNPGGFDYRRYLYEQRIHWVGNVRTVDDLQLVSTAGHVLEPLDRLRVYLGERVAAVYAEPQAGLIRGMILGERQAVDWQVERQFATLGLLHLLAISGLHVGIVLALCYGGLKWLGLTREKAALAALVFLPLYALLTGAAPPVVRASLVSGLALIAVVFQQWKDSLHFLAIAAALMLLMNPYWLFSAGFQLSFIISCGIIIGVPALSARMRRGPSYLRQTLAVTLVAQLCSFPLIIYYFNEFSLVSGLANLVVVPLVSVIVIPLSFVTVILATVAVPLAFLPAQVNAFVIDQVLSISHSLAGWEPFHLTWSTPSVIWIYLYFAVLSLLAFVWLNRPSARFFSRSRVALLFSFALLLFAAYHPYPWWNRPLTVTFLDVGQGDAIVIETPQRQTLLMDAGGKLFFEEEAWQVRRKPFDTGEHIVMPFLRHKGIRSIDYLIMSHGDADHIGGMQAIVEQMPVRSFIRGPKTVDPSEVEQELLTALAARNIPVYRAKSGDGWELEDELSIQFIQPAADQVAESDRNAQSLVLWLSYKGRSIILTGDADQAVEQQIIQKWDLPATDVLKAGHHGSDTSTGDEWLRTIQPKVTILSLGENNRYNHPHPDVVKRLQSAGSQIFRTDQQGGIVVRINHRGTMTVEPSIPEGNGSGV